MAWNAKILSEFWHNLFSLALLLSSSSSSLPLTYKTAIKEWENEVQKKSKIEMRLWQHGLRRSQQSNRLKWEWEKGKKAVLARWCGTQSDYQTNDVLFIITKKLPLLFSVINFNVFTPFLCVVVRNVCIFWVFSCFWAVLC